MRQLGCDLPDDRRTGNGINGASHSQPKKEEEATFDYTDERGQLLFQVVRFRFKNPDGSLVTTPDGKPKKTFLQRHRDPKTGAWIWNVQGVRLVPYRLPDLIKAVAAPKTVLIVEGEKKVDALREVGLQATCGPMGAGKWRAEFAPYFAGAHVVILPDNDTPGQDHGRQIAASLHGAAKSVKVLTLPDLPHKGDVIDWLTAGHNAGELKNLVAKAPAWVPPAENQEAPKKEADPSAETIDEEWPEPTPLPAGLLPVKSFDPQYLPASIAPWVADISTNAVPGGLRGDRGSRRYGLSSSLSDLADYTWRGVCWRN
jgi:5S rRNA maturation endonuclease (ribonuclease M5)